MVPQLDAATTEGVPSMKACTKLVVKGSVMFTAGSVFEGEVTITNTSGDPVTLPPKTYKNETVTLP
jgi:hypothetical protein